MPALRALGVAVVTSAALAVTAPAPAPASAAPPSPQKVAASVVAAANKSAFGKVAQQSTPDVVRTLRYYRQSGYTFRAPARCTRAGAQYRCAGKLLHRKHVVSPLLLHVARVEGTVRVVDVATTQG